jgi:hypothetical protein
MNLGLSVLMVLSVWSLLSIVTSLLVGGMSEMRDAVPVLATMARPSDAHERAAG